jgi:kumamolisin
VTSGDNGGFSAGPGWDATTGLGSPVGGALLTALTSGTAAMEAPSPEPEAAPEDGSDLLTALRSVRTAVDALTAAVEDLAAERRTAPAVPAPREGAEQPVGQTAG